MLSILFLHLLDFEKKGGYTGRMMKHYRKTVLLLLLICAACNDNAAPELEVQPVNIMLYACGDNNLENHILRDLREAEFAGIGGADVTMHVLLDRSGAAVSGFERWSDSRVYKVALNNAAAAPPLHSQLDRLS
jgi:pyrroloquinoline quinone (PQQ) biosynthesis protein C